MGKPNGPYGENPAGIPARGNQMRQINQSEITKSLFFINKKKKTHTELFTQSDRACSRSFPREKRANVKGDQIANQQLNK